MSQIDLRACTPFGLKWDLSRAGTGIQGSEVLSHFPQAAGTAVVALPPSLHCLGWFTPPTPPCLHLIVPQKMLVLLFQRQTCLSPDAPFHIRGSLSAQLELQTYLPCSGMKRPTSQGRRAQSYHSRST